MKQPTLGLLEHLRPPSGFRTAAALGATYSLDLLTCMAVLTTLDGGDGDRVNYGRIEAYRALDRLRDKVRICHQAGRISRRDGRKYPSLALLDRVLVPVRILGGGSFHPKVWLVRQINDARVERYVLIASSRNVTTSTDWDLGVAVEGTVGGSGVALPRVRAFVQHALELAGEADRVASFGSLDDVRWKLPRGTDGMTFDFQEGGRSPRALHREWDAWQVRPSRVLILSPFIDERMVAEAAKRWRDVPKRSLVAGTEGLTAVALGPHRDSLQALLPRQVVAANEATEPQESETGSEPEQEIEQIRALHAKVIALDDGRQATVVVGSNNLTGAGWCGGSTEAFIRLTGGADLCEPLWDWAGAQAELFPLPPPGAAKPTQGLLEALQDRLCTVRFRLEDDVRGGPSLLALLEPTILDLPDGVELAIARYTTPREPVAFPREATTVELPSCPTAFRSRFLVCTLRYGDEDTAWIVSAELDPPIDDQRDRELVARLLGLREFLAYLQSIGSDESIPGTPEGDDDGESDAARPQAGHAGIADTVHLEGLLRRLAAEPETFEEMNSAVVRYGELIKSRSSQHDELALLGRFLEAWAAIRQAFHA